MDFLLKIIIITRMLKSVKIEIEKSVDKSWHNPVIQFSFFVDTRSSQLNELIQSFKTSDISVLAWSFLENSETAIVRCVVNYPDIVRKICGNKSVNYHETKVLAVELSSVDEGIRVVSEIFSAEVKLYYIYPLLARPNGKSGLIVHSENNLFAAKVLHDIGIKTISQIDIGR